MNISKPAPFAGGLSGASSRLVEVATFFDLPRVANALAQRCPCRAMSAENSRQIPLLEGLRVGFRRKFFFTAPQAPSYRRAAAKNAPRSGARRRAAPPEAVRPRATTRRGAATVTRRGVARPPRGVRYEHQIAAAPEKTRRCCAESLVLFAGSKSMNEMPQEVETRDEHASRYVREGGGLARARRT